MENQLNATRTFLYWLSLPLVVIFLLYIGGGYYFSFSTVLTDVSSIIIFGLTLLLILVVYLCLRHTGRQIETTRAFQGYRRYLWIGSFLLLFLFSGYGFLTSSLLLVEGPVIVREGLSNTIEQLSKLNAQAKNSLRVPAYEDIVSRVEALETQLHAEIKNPTGGQFCGVGVRAKDVLKQIAVYLPNVTVLNGTDSGHSCADATYLDHLSTTYNALIDSQLRKHPLAIINRVKERSDYLTMLGITVNTDVSDLEQFQRLLAGVPTFIFNLDLYHRSVSAIEKADGDYEKMYQQLVGFVDPKGVSLPPRITSASMEQIASPVQVLNTLIARANRVSTYIYVFIALFADLLASYLTSLVFMAHKQLQIAQKKRDEFNNVGDTGVKYIWMPELHPDAPSPAN
jgi:hypothetical protein